MSKVNRRATGIHLIQKLPLLISVVNRNLPIPGYIFFFAAEGVFKFIFDDIVFGPEGVDLVTKQPPILLRFNCLVTVRLKASIFNLRVLVILPTSVP